MRLYARASGSIFALIAVGQLIRTVLRVPAQVADIMIPVWPSAVASVLLAGLAIWAFRTAGRVV